MRRENDAGGDANGNDESDDENLHDDKHEESDNDNDENLGDAGDFKHDQPGEGHPNGNCQSFTCLIHFVFLLRLLLLTGTPRPRTPRPST